jgi:predicted phosphodiesterase
MKIGIISDIHEDAERLSTALKLIEKQGCDELICLGDISGFDERYYSYGYSRNLNYCIDLIKVNCRAIIPGNHDFFHLRKLPDYNSVFDFPKEWYELPYVKRKKLSKGKIWLYEKDSIVRDIDKFSSLFESLSNKLIYQYNNLNILFSHSIFPDLSGFLTKKPNKIIDFQEHFKLLKDNNCTIGISGHLHPNGLLKISEKKIFYPKFSAMEIPESEIFQFICPCIADGIQDNGFTVLDSIQRTIESIPLRTPKHMAIFL